MTVLNTNIHDLLIANKPDFSDKKFQEVVDDSTADPKKVKRVVLTFGKIYYDLIERQSQTNEDKIAFVRVEQVYPVPAKQLNNIFSKYSNATEIIWAQEEPENMGAWAFVNRKFGIKNIQLIARHESATPATGSSKVHAKQQTELVDRVFKF